MLVKFKKSSALAAAVLITLPVMGVPAAALEQEEEDNLTVQTRAVMVTATRTEKDLMEVPMSVGVVTEQDILRDPANNIADILEGIPGISVQDGSNVSNKRIVIRGESPGRALIMIDGVKISEQKSMDGAIIMIDPSQIERIEVIKGPASVLYGSEAIAGVVNIITKKGGHKPVAFSQRFVADSSNNSLDVQSAVFGSYHGFNYRFTGSGMNAGDRKTPNGRVANTDFDYRQYSGQVGYEWDSGSLWVRGEKYETHTSLPGAEGIYMGLPLWKRETLSAGLEISDLSRHLVKLKAGAYTQNLKKDFWNDILMNLVTDTWLKVTTFNDQDSFGGSLQTEWRFGDGAHYLIAGADYNRDDLKARATGTYKNPLSPMMRNYARDYEGEQYNTSLFAQDEWTFAEDWALTLGLRQTWVESKFTRTTHATVEDYLGTTRDSHLVGNVGLVYSGFENLALRAIWSQGYRFPPLNQLYIGTAHGGMGYTYPNPDLKPEQSNNYEIGARYNDGAWDMDLAVFYTDAKNYITTISIDQINRMFVNRNKAETWGAELALSRFFPDTGLTPYTTVTWLKRTYTYASGNKTSDTGTPDLSGRVGLKWETETAADQRVFTDLYVKWATDAHERDSGNNRLRNEAWQTLNFTVGTQWGDEHKWNASLSLRNIGDQSYTQSYNALEDPGFHVILGLSFEY